jgi:sugar phosphate isomerase/epimerase
MKIGAQLYTVRDYTRTPRDIEETLRKIKALGFEAIQISGFGPCDVDLLSGWIRELGLEVAGSHVPWSAVSEGEALKKTIAEQKKLGAREFGLGARPGDVFPNSPEGYTRFIKRANEICKQVLDAGLSFGYHNHDFEFEQWNGVRAFDRLIDECPGLKFVLDTFWVQAGGGDPLAYIKKLEGRITIIHFKDYRIVNRARQFAEVGQGNLDWDRIIPLSRDQKIPYAVIEQDGDYLKDPFDSLAMSREFILKKL